MSASKTGASLRMLVLTPERIPSFFIPSPRNPFRASPLLRRGSSDRTRLLSDDDDDTAGICSPETPTGPVASPRFVLRLPTPRCGRLTRTEYVDDADSDVTTRHMPKVTTPYGFRSALAASPFMSRRGESLFHRHKPVKVTVTDAEPEPQNSTDTPPRPPGPRGSRAGLRPVKALGLQMMKELKKPAAALKALSPSRVPSPRKCHETELVD